MIVLRGVRAVKSTLLAQLAAPVEVREVVITD
jgi:hypothetical protein